MAHFLIAVAAARSFGTAHKGLRLHRGVETTVFSRACAADEAPCAMQHWWSGGNFEGYPLLFDAVPFAVTWRNGEPGHGGRAYAVNASSLALVYEW